MEKPEPDNFPEKPDISPLLQTLNHFHPVSDGAVDYLRDHIFEVKIPRGKLLVKLGQICENVYFIRQGVLRGYIREGPKDITTWITAEGELVTSISGLDQEGPAIENIQAIEDCDLLALDFGHLQELYVRFPEFNVLIRKLLQQYYRDAEGRAFIARLTNAESKYKHFLAHHSRLVNRIPLKYVASFLGITLETLSRVRRRISLRQG